MRSPVSRSNGCAPVLASYSAITLFTSSMSAVAGSYSRSVVSPRDENVRTLTFIFGLLWERINPVGSNPSRVILHPCVLLSIRHFLVHGEPASIRFGIRHAEEQRNASLAVVQLRQSRSRRYGQIM